MTDRLTRARDAIGAEFLAENITTPPTRAAYSALTIAGTYPVMKVRRIFGSWSRAMANIIKHVRISLNTAPTVANPLVDQTLDEETALNYQFAANTFADSDTGDAQTLTYSIVGTLPAWVTFTAGTRTFTGTAPTVAENTVYTITVRATDDYGVFVEDSFTITVTAV